MEKRLRTEDAMQELTRTAGIKLGRLFDCKELEKAKNKGKIGQLVEQQILGITPGNALLDFEDGELKVISATINKKGQLRAKGTAAVTMLCLDDVERPPGETRTARKVKNVIYLPLLKVGKLEEWFFLKPVHVNSETFFLEDIELINSEVKSCMKEKRMLKTINGQWLQLRTKDSGKYHPIVLDDGTMISNKRRAYYLKTSYINYLLERCTA